MRTTYSYTTLTVLTVLTVRVVAESRDPDIKTVLQAAFGRPATEWQTADCENCDKPPGIDDDDDEDDDDDDVWALIHVLPRHEGGGGAGAEG